MPVKRSVHSKKEHKSSKSSTHKKTKKGRINCKPMTKGYGCCFTCGKKSKIMSSEIKMTKNHRKQQVSLGACGHKMYQFVKS